MTVNTALEKSGYIMRKRSHHEAAAPLRMLYKPGGMLEKHLEEKKGAHGVIYVHIPYCSRTCSFCNLRRSAGLAPEGYVDMLIKEIKQYAGLQYIKDSTYGAVYFGGGTPTVLKADDLRRLLRALKQDLPVDEDAEITIETSVSNLTEEKIQVFGEEGVNRFSVGVQTFSDAGRSILGRKGSYSFVSSKIGKLLKQGFDNVGIDLIYNYPGQTEEELIKDIETIKNLDISGFSFYSLIIHKGSRLGEQLTQGDLANDMEKYYFNSIYDAFIGTGYSLLELTKIVKGQRDSYRYIKIRYMNGDTLPIGAGAGGKLGNLHFMNPIDWAGYSKKVKDGLIAVRAMETDTFYECIYRLIGSIQFGFPEFTAHGFSEYSHVLAGLNKNWLNRGLIEPDPKGYRLTKEGVYWGNNMASDLAQALVDSLLNRHLAK